MDTDSALFVATTKDGELVYVDDIDHYVVVQRYDYENDIFDIYHDGDWVNVRVKDDKLVWIGRHWATMEAWWHTWDEMDSGYTRTKPYEKGIVAAVKTFMDMRSYSWNEHGPDPLVAAKKVPFS